ncbi:MAG: Hepatitis C virus core protein [Cyanobacteria bacterium M_surface_7_m2_040]|nr:Hepatitis C virus core protein [Cyanobacteria bacterium K_Offshore_0m_m2_072]MBM5808844.1 Hepatitis C virus core protein [Cyanobacteria bacterium M_surface_9_m1_291]MBM5827748.1 Hepatitis C virus core protein [Cyanobacteria bacterium M_surface_7_m2_040]
MLNPPRGYLTLAWLGLVANVLVLPLAVAAILADRSWLATNIAVGAGGVLPTAVVGIVASIALLRWRRWGQILAIVALAMALAVGLPYGIVRLVLVEQNRALMAVLAPLHWASCTAALVFWCRPAIRRYLT